jgi:CHAT domain-containing protein
LAEMLSRTQRETLRDSRYKSPYYWAGYQLSGGGDAGRLVEAFLGRSP